MRLRALADNGLAYSRDPFDIERFQSVAEISHELADLVTLAAPPTVGVVVDSVAGYTTPKLDVRGAVFDATGSLLLVREKADGGWSMPGGWCDILESPREAVAREVFEESGLTVDVLRLAALLDRERWPHQPAFDAHVYKLFFLCSAHPGDDAPATLDEREISDVAWFAIDQLPELSRSRLTTGQVELVHQRWLDPTLPTAFD